MESANKILRSLRNLSILVLHPKDTDGLNLVQQLKRIGCDVNHLWPVNISNLPNADIVIFLYDCVDPKILYISNLDKLTTYIAVIDSENPTLLQTIVEPNIHGFILKPIRNVGILASITKARFDHKYIKRLNNRINKLDQTLRSRRVVERSIRELSAKLGISEDEAYNLLRQEAMSKQISVGEMAESVLNIDGIMNRLTNVRVLHNKSNQE